MQGDTMVEAAAIAGSDQGLARDLLLLALQHDQDSDGAWLELAALVASPAEQRYCLRRALTLNERNWQALSGIVELGTGPLRYPAFLEAVPAPQAQPKETLPPGDLVLRFDGPAPLPGAPLLRPLVLGLLLMVLVAYGYRMTALLL